MDGVLKKQGTGEAVPAGKPIALWKTIAIMAANFKTVFLTRQYQNNRNKGVSPPGVARIMEKSLAVFEGCKIRRHDDEQTEAWLLSVIYIYGRLRTAAQLPNCA